MAIMEEQGLLEIDLELSLSQRRFDFALQCREEPVCRFLLLAALIFRHSDPHDVLC